MTSTTSSPRHLQLHIDDNLRAGMTPDAARRQAMLKLGGVEPVKERVRDRRGLPWLDSLRQDVRYGIRFLRRSPGFTAVAILSLALGIGANTAIFSLLDSLLLRSLPVRQADRLVQVAPGHEPAVLDESVVGADPRSLGFVRRRRCLDRQPVQPV